MTLSASITIQTMTRPPHSSLAKRGKTPIWGQSSNFWLLSGQALSLVLYIDQGPIHNCVNWVGIGGANLDNQARYGPESVCTMYTPVYSYISCKHTVKISNLFWSIYMVEKNQPRFHFSKQCKIKLQKIKIWHFICKKYQQNFSFSQTIMLIFEG